MQAIQHQIVLLLGLTLISFSTFFAQNIEKREPCYFDELKSKQSVLHSENLIQSFLSNKKARQNQKSGSDTIRVIPMVVHVIHNGGPENISMAQINSSIQIINEDFGKLAGTNGAGNGVDTRVRFCLAKKDPKGNCTDGVVRIKSSLTIHQTSQRALLKELSFWDNTRYLNMYVVQSINGNVGGYASFPGGPAGGDGIVVRHDLVGNIGSSVGIGRTTTHEIGHWFGLYHTFNNGCGVDTCSSGDFVCDTPPQSAPSYTCATLNTCSNDVPDVNDLKENYMNYTPDTCMDMLTNGQKQRMHATLDTIRTLIWKQSNLVFTGCDSNYSPPANCPVVADFVSLNRSICKGSSISFMDRSLNEATTFNWSFPGGNPSSSTLQNPIIRYDSVGSFQVRLIASDSTSSDTMLINNYITVKTPGLGDSLSFYDDFDLGVFPANGLTLNNQDSGVTWQIDSQASVSGNYSIKINNLINTNYGSADEIILPYLDLTTAISNKYLFMSFDWAYAKADPTFSDELIVKISTDCGLSFNQIFYRSQGSLTTAPRQTTPFIPTATQWRKANISLSAYRNSDYVQIRIINVPDGGNNLYLDNIYVGNNLGILTSLDDMVEKSNPSKIYPNPANDMVTIDFGEPKKDRSRLSVVNINGKLIRQFDLRNHEMNDGLFHFSVTDLPNGFYYVKLDDDLSRKVFKLLVVN
ncbi:MAG: PKD domain-containing protein [Verrucomicrobia bacterium]|nr:PKD domain-containing protein [Verrucomicrobiota bacterium]